MGAATKQSTNRAKSGLSKTPASPVRAGDRDVSRRDKTTPESRPVRRPKPTAKAVTPAVAAAQSKRQRRVVAFGGLVAVMTVTGALLMAMQPAPLRPDAVKSLMSVETTDQVDALFATETPVDATRWKFIYVHHGGSGTADKPGDVSGAADHFVIGNGQDIGNGEVQVGLRWNAQQPAGRTPGLDHVDPDCISICVAGNLDRAPATPRQTEQLNRLVTALQDRLTISRDRVWVVDAAGLPASCGKYFPREAFRASLLP